MIECEVPNCARPGWRRRLCVAHYNRLVRCGDVKAHVPVRDRRAKDEDIPIEATEIEVAWLAGLLEGEGCFSVAQYLHKQRPSIRPVARVALSMSDQDVVVRAKRIIGATTKTTVVTPPDPKHRPMHQIQISSARAESVMRLVRPYMGTRRGARIDEILAMDLSHHPRKDTA